MYTYLYNIYIYIYIYIYLALYKMQIFTDHVLNSVTSKNVCM